MALGDVLAGFADAGHAHRTNLLNMQFEQAKDLGDKYFQISQSQDYPDEVRKEAMNRVVGLHTMDPGKKIPKEWSDLSFTVQPPTPAPTQLPPPQSAVPGLQATMDASAPPPIQAPTPPPTQGFTPYSPEQLTQQAAARAGAVATATEAAKPVKPPQMDIKTFGKDSSGLYNSASGEILHPSQDIPSPTPPARVGEYNFYAQQEVAAGRQPKSFNDWDLQSKEKPDPATSLAMKQADDWIAKNPGKDFADYEAYKIKLGKSDSEANSSENRLQSSYQFHVSQLAALSKPVDDSLSRFSKLQDTLSQADPQADALVAPELLTVMAGGQGSGLRMNEAEIARIVGGRSKWQDLKASINKWNTDPKAARSITPEQDAQIRSLIQTVGQRLNTKQQAIYTAQQDIANATDVNGHKQALLGLRKALDAVDAGTSASTSGVKPGEQTATNPSTGEVLVLRGGKWVKP